MASPARGSRREVYAEALLPAWSDSLRSTPPPALAAVIKGLPLLSLLPINAPPAAPTVSPMMRVGLTPAQLVSITPAKSERRMVAFFITRHHYRNAKHRCSIPRATLRSTPPPALAAVIKGLPLLSLLPINAPPAAPTVSPMMRVGLTPAQLVSITPAKSERRMVAFFITRHHYRNAKHRCSIPRATFGYVSDHVSQTRKW